jgi:hypothetical protein
LRIKAKKKEKKQWQCYCRRLLCCAAIAQQRKKNTQLPLASSLPYNSATKKKHKEGDGVVAVAFFAALQCAAKKNTA